MFFLVDVVTKKIITQAEKPTDFADPIGAMQKAGTAVWVEADVQSNMAKVDATGKVVLDEARKAEKDKLEADQQARKDILKDLKDVADPAVKKILKALIEELGLDRGN